MAYKNYEFFYEGIYKPIEQDYGELFTGYRSPMGSIGASTSIQTANQVREVSSRLNEGMKVVEMSVIDPRVMGTIPKQHMQEINQLSKLTGTETTLHAPIIDPAGFTQQGWSENSRAQVEREMLQAVERAHDLNPEGNVPVTFHSSAWGFPAKEYERTKQGIREVALIAVNPETGQPSAFKREEVYRPGKKPEEWTPERRLESYNETSWINQTTGLLQMSKHADELLNSPTVNQAKPIYDKVLQGKYSMSSPEVQEAIGPAIATAQKAQIFYQDVDAGIRNMYDNAYKYGVVEASKEDVKSGVAAKRAEKLDKFSKKYTKIMEEIQIAGRKGDILGTATRYEQLCTEGINAMQDLTVDRDPKTGRPISELPAVQMMRPVEEFAIDKSAKTIANIAFDAYKKFGKSTPIVSLENPPPQVGGFSRAEDLRDLVKESREKFVKKAVASGMSESKAIDVAEKTIGATWDVGHINLLRRGGFTEQDIIEETKKIAPYVKHVHIVDNFGYQETHLPPGMGTVPIKPMLEELKAAGFRGKQIVEAGEFVQHFGASPHPYVLEALGSPLYDIQMAPYWNQVHSSYGGYFSGYGTMLPEEHFSMYGGGFSTLPKELGGRVSGKQSRLSGTPME